MNLKLSDKKILVTGGAGFIGSNLCFELLKLGNNVVCMDNLSTGKKTNIHSLLKNDNFKFFNADIRNLEDCINISKGIDYIFHQAALGSVPRSINDPVTTNDVNIGGFLNILIAASSIAINPNFFHAHRLLSRITIYKKNDEHLSQLST